MKKFGNTPVYTSGFTYDSVYMMAEVIKQKKSVKSDDIVVGLENISYKGVIHPEIGFDKQSHDLLEGRYVMPLSHGRKAANKSYSGRSNSSWAIM